MDKNLFLAIALSILVYAGWFAWMEKHAPPRAPAPPPAAPASPDAAPAASITKAPDAPPRKLSPPPAADAARLELELPHAGVELTGAGAAISGFEYRGTARKVQLVVSAKAGFFATWPEVAFKAAKRDGELRFEGRLPTGAAVEKVFRLDPNGGWNRLELTVRNPTDKPVEAGPVELSVGPGLGIFAEVQKGREYLRAVEYLDVEKRAHNIKPKKAAKPGWLWAGIDNVYFAAVFKPEPGNFTKLESQHPDDGPLVVFASEPIRLAPGASKTLAGDFYLGPKAYDHLKSLGSGLQHSVDFGFFGLLGRAAYQALKSIYKVTGNYGWAIILLTLVIQVFTFPLTYKSLKSAAGMKRLAPKIQAIQKKFESDPKRMNVEMMELYKASGTNPLSGCLPLLLQMPIFLALFNALNNAWELQGAPWMFWIRDLSAKDPFYVLPVIMGALMFVQQKLQPPAPDPAQAKMMQFMPIIMTFFFLNFASGLVLYWTTNSVLSLVSQLALKSRLEAA